MENWKWIVLSHLLLIHNRILSGIVTEVHFYNSFLGFNYWGVLIFVNFTASDVHEEVTIMTLSQHAINSKREDEVR